MHINDIRIAEHFSLREFQCPCCHRVMIHPGLLMMLVKLRALWNRPMIVTSGYRCAGHNGKVGGVPRSLHMVGQAADIAVMARDQPMFAEYARKAGFSTVLSHRSRNYVHLGIGGK